MGHRERAAERAGALRILGALGDAVGGLAGQPAALIQWIQDRTLEEMASLPVPNSGPATSQKAAAAMFVSAGSLRARALQAYEAGPLTDEEVGTAVVHPRIWPRCSELRSMRLIEPTGELRTVFRTGQWAECCRLTDAGRETLRILRGSR